MAALGAVFLVTSSFMLFSSFREGTNLLLISLAVADFLVCAVYQPSVFRFTHPAKPILLVNSIAPWVQFTASLNGLLTVTFDRFVAIYFPYVQVHHLDHREEHYPTYLDFIGGITSNWNIKLPQKSHRWIRSSNVHHCDHHRGAYPVRYYLQGMKQTRRMTAQSTALTSELRRGHNLLISKTTTGVGLVLLTTLLCWLPYFFFQHFQEVWKQMKNSSKCHDMVFGCRLFQLMYQSIYLLLQVPLLSASYQNVVSSLVNEPCQQNHAQLE